MSNSVRKRPKIASHAGHFASRHVLEEMLQRGTPTLDVSTMHRVPPPWLRAATPCPTPLPSWSGCWGALSVSSSLPLPFPSPSIPSERAREHALPWPPSCCFYCAQLCCCFGREDMTRVWPRLPLLAPTAGGQSPRLSLLLCSLFVVSSLRSLSGRRRRDLGLEYETTQGSRCEAKTVCGLWRDSWKIQGSRGKSVFLFFVFADFLVEFVNA